MPGAYRFSPDFCFRQMLGWLDTYRDFRRHSGYGQQLVNEAFSNAIGWASR